MMQNPGIIRKLHEVVINRIAAGEVIQRPANALKELLENSLDAQSTSIQVLLKEGGLKLLQVQDNGTGIYKADLIIVCERFTTSKLQKFDDLSTISTFGFRGEALASISHCAHLTITTKTKDSKCAYRLSYTDGEPKDPPPKPCAGNQGTLIQIEDLFYNMSIRRSTLRSHSEEHSRIVDVVGKYAIHNPTVSFVVKKQGETSTDLRTTSSQSSLDIIRILYGTAVGRELVSVSCEDPTYSFKMNGYISNVNFSMKKCTFILFINHRLVDCKGLKKSMELIYASYLPKNSHPFMYIDLQIEPHNVDINVHPTKYEVHFLHEEVIIEKIQKAVETKLLNSNTSRTFYSKMTAVPVSISSEPSTSTSTTANHMVRTDWRTQKLERFLSSDENSTMFEDNRNTAANGGIDPNRREIDLTSVLKLRKEVENNCHSGLRLIIRNSNFVGCVSPTHLLLQYDTKLYLCNIQKLSEELFYQIMLYDFGNFGHIKLSNPCTVYSIAMLALDLEESGWTDMEAPKENVASYFQKFLISKSDMLTDYFSFHVDQQGCLDTLPLLLDGYIPSLAGLPMYLLHLGVDIDWDKEKECFQSISRETAMLYSNLRIVDDISASNTQDSQNSQNSSSSEEKSSSRKNWKWLVEFVLLPAYRKMLLPPKQFADNGTIIQVANLPDLYKVFERC